VRLEGQQQHERRRRGDDSEDYAAHGGALSAGQNSNDS
jgi:hypothetical protein